MNWVRRKLNAAGYRYRENRWRRPPRLRRPTPKTPVDRPFSLLGLPGTGLGLTARTLRRTPGVASATGNHHDWVGNDEIQKVAHGQVHENLGDAPPGHFA